MRGTLSLVAVEHRGVDTRGDRGRGLPSEG